MKKAVFGGEYIIKEESILRPVVTVNRTGKGLANNEKDLIVCGCCGAVETYRAKFCMGCGAKFMTVKDISKYKEYESSVSGVLDGQISIADLEVLPDD